MADGTSSSLTVAAPRGTVLGVIADFAHYPDWATGIRSAEVVEDGEGGLARRVRFNLDAGLIKDSYVLAYEWDGEAGVSWRLAEPGSVLTQMSGAYVLEGEASGTRVKYELAVATRGLPMPGMLKRRAEKMIIDAALRGLKERAEAAAAQGGAGGQGRTPGRPAGR